MAGKKRSNETESPVKIAKQKVESPNKDATEDTSQKVKINRGDFDMEQFRYTMFKQPTKQLTHLTLSDFYNIEMLDYIYEYFTNLQFLCLDCKDNKKEGWPLELEDFLLPTIVKATQLVELNLLQINFSLGFSSKKADYHNDSVRVLKILRSGQDCSGHKVKDWPAKLNAILPNLTQLVVGDPYDGDEINAEVEKDRKSDPTLLKELKELIYKDDYSVD